MFDPVTIMVPFWVLIPVLLIAILNVVASVARVFLLRRISLNDLREELSV